MKISFRKSRFQSNGCVEFAGRLPAFLCFAMNENNLRAFYQDTSSTGYVDNALNARRHRDKVIQQLLEKACKIEVM